MKKLLILLLIPTLYFPTKLSAQNERTKTHQEWGSNLWVGFYNTFRLSDRLFWRAEMHYRRGDYEGTPFVGKMGQIYNRHALNYLITPNFNVSLGGVLRINFTPDPGNEEFYEVTHEPRIWHEYLFIMPFPRYQIYHRARIEHRWSRSNRIDADWVYRDRWRYKFYMKIPLNNRQLVPGTIYFSPDVEIILQTGKSVIGSHVEDLRIYPSFSYISNPRVTYSLGMMYTTGQDLNDPSVYSHRWVARLSAYISLDLRRLDRTIPAIKSLD